MVNPSVQCPFIQLGESILGEKRKIGATVLVKKSNATTRLETRTYRSKVQGVQAFNYWHHIPCILDSILCKSLSCTACRAGGWLGGWLGRDGAGGGTVGVAVAGRGVVFPDEEADDVLLGPGEDCTLVGL